LENFGRYDFDFARDLLPPTFLQEQQLVVELGHIAEGMCWDFLVFGLGFQGSLVMEDSICY
jgi:hypothetical protein